MEVNPISITCYSHFSIVVPKMKQKELTSHPGHNSYLSNVTIIGVGLKIK